MAAFNKFNVFVEDHAKGVHQLHAAGHTIKAYLTNATPDAASDAVKADLAEISAGNGYTAGGVDIQNDISRAGGVATMTGVDANIAASGGSIGPFRYAVLYNSSVAGGPLIGWWDYGTSVTLADGEDIDIDLGAAVLTFE